MRARVEKPSFEMRITRLWKMCIRDSDWNNPSMNYLYHRTFLCPVPYVHKVGIKGKNQKFPRLRKMCIRDSLKGDGLRVEAAVHLANTVTAHLHIGDGLLGGLADFL